MVDADIERHKKSVEYEDQNISQEIKHRKISKFKFLKKTA